MEKLETLLTRAETLLQRLERVLPAPPADPDWSAPAHRWHPDGGLRPIHAPHLVALEDLLCLEAQKRELARNTRQFVHGLPANNALLWGSRGTGKSSLVKALLGEFAADGLRLIEVERQGLAQLPAIIHQLSGRDERFIVYSDDLSFEADDPSYKALKALLDGSLTASPENLLIYATSNRRHLMPEYMSENREARIVDGELHHGETTEEKVSRSERFGLWLSFHPFKQEEYLRIVHHWASRLGAEGDEEQRSAEALRWAHARGSRSGRVAAQFARDWAGRRLSDG